MSADLVDWDLVLWFGGCVAAFILTLTVLGLCRASDREMPAPPVEPIPGTILRACVVINGRRSHEYRVVRDGEGVEWFICGRCGETVRRAS
jgi:hypothetical protein